MKICQQTRNITFDKTAGELTALILESKKVKELNPIYNRRLRRVSRFHSIHLEEGENGILIPQVISLSEIPSGRKKLYGLFPSNKKAKDSIQAISDEYKLCYQVCGLERSANRACTSHQLKKCEGYCVGRQTAIIHNVKLLQGLSTLALKTWPYQGPIALIEKCKHYGVEQHLLIDNWCILGIAESVEDYGEILTKIPSPEIDKDIYKYLVKAIYSKGLLVKVNPL